MTDYASGITEITKALYKSKDKLQPVKFREYLENFNTQAVYKRLGFIFDQLDLFPELQDYISGNITPSYTPLDPTATKYGQHHSRWGIIDNMNFKTALKSIET